MQCSVYMNAGESESYAPYLLDVQADVLDGLESRVMVPLVRVAEFGRRAGRLHPVFTVCGEEVVMATHLLAAIRSSGLGRAVDALISQRNEIIGALDVLLVGC
jgi:toxin CcdB